MDLSELIAPHLPFLRRYARALTGNQHSGDAHVRACLEAVLAAPDRIEPNLPSRVALYRLFHVIWGSTTLDTTENDNEPRNEQASQKRLRQLAPECREALLLTALEGFSRPEAAQILDDTEDGIDDLVATAVDDIARDLTTEVLIIEDEPVIAMDLEGIVEGLGHRVRGIARTKQQATAMAESIRPGLILADIQLADGSSGIDAVREIQASRRVPVIFISAFPQELLTGARPEPTFLISKPFLADSVRVAIGQALFFYPPSEATSS